VQLGAQPGHAALPNGHVPSILQQTKNSIHIRRAG
jgi:hypothetical protein